MYLLQSLAYLTLTFLLPTQAARISLYIPATQRLPNPAVLPSSTHATLQSAGEPLRAYLTRQNTLVFPNVSAGSYLATVHCRDYLFEPLRVDVTAADAAGAEGGGTGEKVKVWQTFRGNEWENLGEVRGEGSGDGDGLVVEVRCLGAKEFYQERGGCELSFLFSSSLSLSLSQWGKMCNMRCSGC
jgi:hypothetical protein